MNQAEKLLEYFDAIILLHFQMQLAEVVLA